MDFIKDQSNKALWWVAAKDENAVPEYVKAAKLPHADELDHVQDHLFADPVNREFPMHNKVAAWMGYVYAKGGGRTDIVDTIRKTAKTVGVTDEELTAVDDVFNQNIKSAALEQDDDQYALSVDFGDTVKYGRFQGVHHFFPINDAAQVEDSALKIANKLNDLPIEWIKRASENLVHAAHDHGVPSDRLPSQIMRWGGEYDVDWDAALEVAEKRADHVEDPETAELYVELVKAAGQDENAEDDCLYGWAELDRINNIKYSASVPDPCSAIYSGPRLSDLDKIAGQLVTVGDYNVPLEDFAETNWSELTRVMRRNEFNRFVGEVNEATQTKNASNLQECVDHLDAEKQAYVLASMFNSSVEG